MASSSRLGSVPSLHGTAAGRGADLVHSRNARGSMLNGQRGDVSNISAVVAVADYPAADASGNNSNNNNNIVGNESIALPRPTTANLQFSSSSSPPASIFSLAACGAAPSTRQDGGVDATATQQQQQQQPKSSVLRRLILKKAKQLVRKALLRHQEQDGHRRRRRERATIQNQQPENEPDAAADSPRKKASLRRPRQNPRHCISAAQLEEILARTASLSSLSTDDDDNNTPTTATIASCSSSTSTSTSAASCSAGAVVALAQDAKIVEFDCSGVLFRAELATVRPLLEAKHAARRFLEVDPLRPNAAAASPVRRFFVNREPEAFGLLLQALRRARYHAEIIASTPAASASASGGGGGAASLISAYDSSISLANPRVAPLSLNSEFTLMQEAFFFDCVRAVWQSLPRLRFSQPCAGGFRCMAPPPHLAHLVGRKPEERDNDDNDNDAGGGGCEGSSELKQHHPLEPFRDVCRIEDGTCLAMSGASPTLCAIASPWVSSSAFATCIGSGGVVDSPGGRPPSVVEVAFKIDACEYVGLGVVTRAAARRLDREFHDAPGCCCLYMTGVVHNNYFGRYRRFDTDATFGAGDLVTVRIDMTSNIVSWRRNMKVILSERIAPPPEFMEALPAASGSNGENGSGHGNGASYHPGDLAVAVVVRRGSQVRKVFMDLP